MIPNSQTNRGFSGTRSASNFDKVLVSPTPSGAQSPCPGEGYTCDDCLDGWFCPPSQTPALSAPCGNGWPCYHCAGGWFCVPSPTLGQGSVTGLVSGQAMPTETPSPEDHTMSTTVTSTAFVTVPAAASSVLALHPAIADWQYGGCFKDDTSRALKNASITIPDVSGMTSERCITFCQAQGFRLAGVEYGSQCFCGNVLLDSWLLGDSICDSPCSGDSTESCGGNWALSVWSPDGKVPMAAGPEQQFSMPTPTPGQAEMTVNRGGVRQSIVPITTPVFAWPAPAAVTPSTTLNSVTVITMVSADSDPEIDTAIDVDGIASTVRAIVSAAMTEAHLIAASEVAKANAIIAGVKSIIG
ncbi:WSC domain-containing protein, partial [Diplogelasinospora grovesii]